MVRPAATRIASFAAAAAASLSLMTLPPAADAHPLCYYGPDRAVSFTAEATFCPNDDPEGFCCEPDEEDAVATKFASAGTLSEGCDPLYKEVGWFVISVLGPLLTSTHCCCAGWWVVSRALDSVSGVLSGGA